MDWLYHRLPHHVMNESKKKKDKTSHNNNDQAPPSTESASDLAAQINKSILKLYGKFLSDDGKAVDYKGLAASEEFQQFVADTQKLKSVTLSDLNEDERKAFFLNIYNALVIHGYVSYGIPKDKMGFYQRTCYIIGGVSYSLDDIEHGVLRENRKHPAKLISQPQFTEGDPRKAFSVTLDPRVHFALVCGAKSCPPIRVYNSSILEQGLTLAAKAFCNEEHNLLINTKEKSIHISSLFKWYFHDFAESKENLLEWLKQFLNETNASKLQTVLDNPPYTVDYIVYDWSLNE